MDGGMGGGVGVVPIVAAGSVGAGMGAGIGPGYYATETTMYDDYADQPVYTPVPERSMARAPSRGSKSKAVDKKETVVDIKNKEETKVEIKEKSIQKREPSDDRRPVESGSSSAAECCDDEGGYGCTWIIWIILIFIIILFIVFGCFWFARPECVTRTSEDCNPDGGCDGERELDTGRAILCAFVITFFIVLIIAAIWCCCW
jgi:hypothetical protein